MAHLRRIVSRDRPATRPLVALSVLLALAAAGCGGAGGGGGSDGGEPPQTAERSAAYSVSRVETLGALTTASDVNEQGVVVGSGPAEGGAAGELHSFAWQDGTAADLGPIAAHGVNDQGEVSGDVGAVAALWHADGAEVPLAYGSARALNDEGHVVGEARTAQGRLRAFRWDGVQVTALETLGGDNSGAYAVNDAGQAAGWSEDADGLVRACAWSSAGLATDLGTLGGERSMAYGINDGGTVVGYAATAGGVDHAFLAGSGAAMIDLGSLGGYSVAYDVDASGRVVGESAAADGMPHAFLWQDGEMIDLNDLLPAGSPWLLTRALALSDTGHVVGQGILEGVERAFLLTLVPSEPSAL